MVSRASRTVRAMNRSSGERTTRIEFILVRDLLDNQARGIKPVEAGLPTEDRSTHEDHPIVLGHENRERDAPSMVTMFEPIGNGSRRESQGVGVEGLGEQDIVAHVDKVPVDEHRPGSVFFITTRVESPSRLARRISLSPPESRPGPGTGSAGRRAGTRGAGANRNPRRPPDS